jgi:cytoskeletal protein RodZ
MDTLTQPRIESETGPFAILNDEEISLLRRILIPLVPLSLGFGIWIGYLTDSTTPASTASDWKGSDSIPVLLPTSNPVTPPLLTRETTEQIAQTRTSTTTTTTTENQVPESSPSSTTEVTPLTPTITSTPPAEQPSTPMEPSEPLPPSITVSLDLSEKPEN